MKKQSNGFNEYSSLFDLRAKDVKTEAEVETRFLAPLFSDLGYPATCVVPKKNIPPLIINDGTKTRHKTVDFFLLRPDKSVSVIVEAKSPEEELSKHWGQAASYALSHNKDKADDQRIKWLLMSNGHISSLFKHDSNVPIVTLRLSDFASGSPPYVALRGYIKYRSVQEPKSGKLPFDSIAPDKLNKLFKESHDYVWKKEKHTPTDAFFEFCKFIFLKIREDKKREVAGDIETFKLPMTLDWLNAQAKTSVHPVRDILFQQLRNDLEENIRKEKKKRIFEPNETLKLSAGTCKELIRRFEKINLSSIDEDLNGRMFEVFLNAAVRGRALGQYFTPRPVVDFMTRIGLYSLGVDLMNPPKIMDACCGTGGFLIEAMAHLLSALRNDNRFNETEQKNKRDLICNERLFGVDANERVARIARINMYLHGDGGSHVFNADGLDRESVIADDMLPETKAEISEYLQEVTPGQFDLVLTNPPFSMTYYRKNEDEERILAQRQIATSQRSAKSNVLFLDRYFELLRPGGQMLIIIDDTVLNGDSFKKERQWLFDNFVVLGIHSLPFNAFFKAKANIKTSILHIRKKTKASETQGHVFMSISNNIGHDNALKDTPERNNLPDILSAYFEWRRTGKLTPTVKKNTNNEENLECSEQIWIVNPEDFGVDRIDAFSYSPELFGVRAELLKIQRSGSIVVRLGKDFVMRKKLSKKEKQSLRESNTVHKYIEISDVTNYGLIVTHLEAKFSELPTRAEYQVKAGDVLFAINNSSRGTVVIVPEEFDGALCTSGFYVIIPRTQEERLLLWYSLRSDYAKKQIYYMAQTASQPELKSKAWKTQFKVPIVEGGGAKEALVVAENFQGHLSALLTADKVKYGA